MATGTIERPISKKILYSGSFSDTSNITLSETAANFSEMIIQYQNSDGFTNAVHVVEPNTKRVYLTTANIDSTNAYVYIKSKAYYINNTILQRVTNSSSSYIFNGEGYFSASNQGVSSGGRYIGVTKVIGIY